MEGQVEDASLKRDVKNHILFEVSTEVASRGSCLEPFSARPPLTASLQSPTNRARSFY